MSRHGAALAAFLVALSLAGCGGTPPARPTATAEPIIGPGTTSSADGVEIAFTVHSAGSPTLVLVHGWMCDQSYWDPQVPQLAETFGVVTVDVAGHGASGGNREGWTIASLGDDVKAVIEAASLERVIVAGHSMGGFVALDVAAKLPGTVIGVIGVDTLHDARATLDPAEMERFLSAFDQDFPGACGGFVASMFGESADATLVQAIADDMCSGPPEVGTALLRAYGAFDRVQGYSRAGVPIRAINADKWPTDVDGNRRLADFEVTLLEGFGHFLMQEAPEQLTHAMIEATLAIVAATDGAGD